MILTRAGLTARHGGWAMDDVTEAGATLEARVATLNTEYTRMLIPVVIRMGRAGCSRKQIITIVNELWGRDQNNVDATEELLAALKQADQHIGQLVDIILVLNPSKVRREDWCEKARDIISARET